MTQVNPPNVVDPVATPPLSDAWKAIMKWPPLKTMHSPNSLDCPDLDQPTEVCLVVKLPLPQSVYLPHTPTNPALLHWSIRWGLGHDIRDRHSHSYERIIELERAAPTLNHLTNWGPRTKLVRPGAASTSLRIPISTLTLKQRQTLERLALTQPVKDPDGIWNCQHWITDILLRATTLDDTVMEVLESPLLTMEQVNTVLDRARNME